MADAPERSHSTFPGNLHRPTAIVSGGRSREWTSNVAVDAIAAKQGVIDDSRIGLYVAGEAPKHIPDGGAGVLGLVLDEDVLLVSQHDEKVPLLAQLPPAVWNGSGRIATPVASVERRNALCLASSAMAIR